MTTIEVARRLVELCKQGSFVQAQDELYDTDIVSIDPDGSRTLGKANMRAKELRFLGNVEKMENIRYSEVMVAGSYFTVILSMEMDIKGVGHRILDEVCVYQVGNGKIVFEQFFRDL